MTGEVLVRAGEWSWEKLMAANTNMLMWGIEVYIFDLMAEQSQVSFALHDLLCRRNT